MANIAAIRWLTQGRNHPPIIQYMLLDERLEYLIQPQEITVTHLKTNLKEIFATIERKSKDNLLELHYKSVLTSFWRPRRDSKKFHKLINKYLIKKGLFKNSHRTSYLLKKENLAFFKNALYFLDIDCKTKGKAYVAHLWTIALSVTKGRMLDAIKQLWKSRYGIKRMNKEQLSRFMEFYSAL